MRFVEGHRYGNGMVLGIGAALHVTYGTDTTCGAIRAIRSRELTLHKRFELYYSTW
jgi:hypothetical protein